ncbi:hypothetical protein T12_1964 [Trichinella patagoniensis]|uniref:Uncharacterized protein n=1 Tax=Trichinella patagoniensis TaxID=990121 RepID=A0A0V1A8L6_9BILA|nr:hypothetical protein T12_1964 [Trichinella patagoniensis]
MQLAIKTHLLERFLAKLKKKVVVNKMAMLVQRFYVNIEMVPFFECTFRDIIIKGIERMFLINLYHIGCPGILTG